MFIVSLTYKVPLDQIDAHLAEHVEWLKAGYARGVFIVSGRKIPRDGGIIMAGGDRDRLQETLKGDPFHRHDLADYVITEFEPSMTANGFERMAGI